MGKKARNPMTGPRLTTLAREARDILDIAPPGYEVVVRYERGVREVIMRPTAQRPVVAPVPLRSL